MFGSLVSAEDSKVSNMYRWMILLSLVAGLLTASYIMHRRGVPGNNILMSTFLNLLLVFHGGLTATYFLSSGTALGLNATGGAAGMLIGSLIFSIITPEYRWDYFTAYILALPLMYGIGKIGCSFAGCCAGIQYSGPFAITNNLGIKIFPIQIVEVIVFLGAFAVSFYYELKGKYEPFVAAIIYSLIKIVLDFLRDTHSTKMFTPNQYFCLIVIIFCFVHKWGVQRSREEKNEKNK